jgi:O-acetyl-ADP-ribose deacetylase
VRKPVLDVYVDVITEEEALHGILIAPGEHVPFIGAGVSKEAGVPLATDICDHIRQQLQRAHQELLDDEWARQHLNWDDMGRRYGKCLELYGTSEDRVNYFRRLLQNRRPAFAHHALALLMANDKLSRNAMTTNFDKLLEQAFVEQNIRECQAIRMPAEAEFWGPEPDKCYLFKLHGDYDTHNILNTRDETHLVPEFFNDMARETFRSRGLLALGSAGNEESIYKFLEQLLVNPQKRFLSRGIRWGVFLAGSKPASLSNGESAELVAQALEEGVINRRLVEILSDLNRRETPCSFFPVWGSGRFLLRLIDGMRDTTLLDQARLLLDHEMRLRTLFEQRGLSRAAIDAHLEKLRLAQDRLQARTGIGGAAHSQAAVLDLTPTSNVEIVYGDITSHSLLAHASHGGRRAVISADDTLISAGGGVALSLLTAAGAKFMLNEVGKLSPIPHGAVAVTSGGNLPVHYVLHAAALDIDHDGNYLVTVESVRSAMQDALRKAAALGIQSVLTPLLGAGLAGLSPSDSLRVILEVIRDSPDQPAPRHIGVVVYDEKIVSREKIKEILAAVAGDK